MRGEQRIVVGNARVQFKLTLCRNITVLRGKSATGKTTLIDLIAEYESEGPKSGVNLSCAKHCTVLAGQNWMRDLGEIENSIVFIDEASDFVKLPEFGSAAKHSDNYFVIASREKMSVLPYSVEEIYEIRNTTSKYPGVRKFYSQAERMYVNLPTIESPEVVIVEDSNAGYQFYRALCEKSGITCVSAEGKSNVIAKLMQHCDKRTLLIADGAAFGPEMELVEAAARKHGAGLFLPESFEWVILSSGLVRDNEIDRILENPVEYIESSEFFSWETFFTSVLVKKTSDSYLRYRKAKLNPAYLQEREAAAIRAQLAPAGL